MKRLFPALPAVLLSSCGLNDAISFQDHANKDVSGPQGPEELVVKRDLVVTFTRGAIATEYKAKLAKGRYDLVATGKNGAFYQAPYGSFEYSKAGEVESRSGGVYVPKGEGPQHVWFFPRATSKDRDATIRAKGWPATPEGLQGVPVRAWVESGFVVSDSDVSR